jgi:hypothetical protein
MTDWGYHLRCPECGYGSDDPEPDRRVAMSIVQWHLEQDHGLDVGLHNVQEISATADASEADHPAFIRKVPLAGNAVESGADTPVAADGGVDE